MLTVFEVYGGDTLFIDLPDQHPLFGKRMGVRVIGIDTPEIRTKNSCEKQKAQKAKNVQKDKDYFRAQRILFWLEELLLICSLMK